ncbi:MAG TPA: preprotein translocase subunit YajC [Bacillota bacterium]|jgi:preprotein translocase subunit YajC|nr:preprotein translocase subunit YajC [Bacillota bacterium]HOL09630.1 preprotein translocase subunit YajC [Bacillota bacterium]HPO97625.1 preprotein translocase subunit YajC [Bacillota bacterium]
MPNAGGASGLLNLLPMIIVFGAFWFLLVMPQRKQQKERNEMLSNLKKGDKIITIGGMHGEIVDLDDDEVRLRISDKVEVKFNRSAVAKVKGEKK